MLHIKSACANITKICPLNCDKRASTQHCLGSMASNSTSASDSHPPQTPYSTGQINSRFKIFAFRARRLISLHPGLKHLGYSVRPLRGRGALLETPEKHCDGPQ